MRVLVLFLRLTSAAVLGACVSLAPNASAQSIFPPAASLSPGDVLVRSNGLSARGWHKFDTTTGLAFSLPWIPSNLEGIAFDEQGSILTVIQQNSQYRFAEVHPLTGELTTYGPVLPGNQYDIAANGDAVFVKPASSATKNGSVWSGGADGSLHVYSRQADEITSFPKPEHFSPMSAAMGVNGEIYIADFFRGIQRVDLQSGTLMDVGAPSATLASVKDSFSDGDLLISLAGDSSRYRRFDPSTGAHAPYDNGLVPVFVDDVSLDGADNAWIASTLNLYFIDGASGNVVNRALPSGLQALALAIVPDDWTPPLPEPTSFVLLAVGATWGGHAHRSRLMASFYARQRRRPTFAGISRSGVN